MLTIAARAVAAALLAVLVCIAVGGAMSAASQTHSRGRMVDIGGRALNLVCAGPADDQGPLVVMEAGAFGLSADWGAVQDGLAARGVRSCAYDRAGLGRSDPGPVPRDANAVVADLEALLKAAGEPGPFILAGHSMAGLSVRLFTARNAGSVKGVVLVDAATPEASDHPLVRRFIATFGAASRWAARGAALGLFKPLAPFMGDRIGLPAAAAADKRRAFASAAHNHWSAREVIAWPDSAKEAAAAAPYDPALPVAVVTAGPAEGRMKDWKAMQAGPARASAHGHVENIAAAGHATLLGQAHAEAVVRAIMFVREAGV